MSPKIEIQSVEQLIGNLAQSKAIVVQMHMERDHTTQMKLAEASIALDALQLNYEGQNAEIKQQLIKLQGHEINLILDEVVRNCLAYYALAEQPLGTNEPPIGPVFAQQLLAQLDDSSADIHQVKNALHQHLNSNDGQQS